MLAALAWKIDTSLDTEREARLELKHCGRAFIFEKSISIDITIFITSLITKVWCGCNGLWLTCDGIPILYNIAPVSYTCTPPHTNVDGDPFTYVMLSQCLMEWQRCTMWETDVLLKWRPKSARASFPSYRCATGIFALPLRHFVAQLSITSLNSQTFCFVQFRTLAQT